MIEACTSTVPVFLAIRRRGLCSCRQPGADAEVCPSRRWPPDYYFRGREEIMQRAFQNWSNWLTLDKSRATQAGYTWEMRQLIRRFPDKGLNDYQADDLLA